MQPPSSKSPPSSSGTSKPLEARHPEPRHPEATPSQATRFAGQGESGESTDSVSVRVEALGVGGGTSSGGAGSGRGSAGGRLARRRPRPPKLYRIGEVVEYSGMSRQTIHNYTTMGLLQEMSWTRGGHRLYPESVFERLDHIAELKAQRKSMEHIRNYFAQRDKT